MSLSIFEIFKIVLGIVIASFFLYFMLEIAGIYSFTEGRSGQLAEYKNAKKLIEDTYVYSVQAEMDMKKPPIFHSPPYVSESDAISVNPSIMYFFKPGNRLVVYKGSADYGFWNLDFVGALGQTAIIYSLNEYDMEDYSLLHNITELFPQSADPKIEFGFCNGDQELAAKSKDEFIKPIRGIIRTKSPQNLGLAICTASFSEPKKKIVITKGVSEPLEDNGYVIQILQGSKIGAIYFKERDKEGKENKYKLVYKDALDIFSAIVGGVDSYKYKNRLQFEGLLAFSKEEAKRANLLALTFSNPDFNKTNCAELYTRLGKFMDGEFKSFTASAINLQNYNNPDEMEKVLGLIDKANARYTVLKAKSCE